MSIEQKDRLHSLMKKILTALAVGFGYLIFAKITGWGIPCVYFLITKHHCPGCGISRMFLSLAELDFAAAARYNLLALCLLPVALMLFVYRCVKYIKTGIDQSSTAENVLYGIVCVLAIAFAVLRNTDWIPFLQMP